MIHLVKFLVKLVATLIGFPIFCLQIIISILMWNKKFVRNVELLEEIWYKN